MTEYSPTPQAAPGGHLLVAQDIHTSFGQTTALCEASLDLDAGETVAVMRRSG